MHEHRVNSISAPTAERLARVAWMDYEKFFDADPDAGIIWHDDAPEEALASYELWRANEQPES